MEESTIREADNTSGPVFVENKPINPSIASSSTSTIKYEEFDVDEFLSNENDEIVCPSSPDSEPVSPANESIIEIDNSFKLCSSDQIESSLVGDSTTDGSRMISVDNFIDDEFLLSSCTANDLNNACNITDVDDPFSELFPSLLSV